VVRDDNGTLRLRRSGTIRVGSDGPNRRAVTYAGPDATYEAERIVTWRNRSHYIVALTDEGETEYDARVSSGHGQRLYSVYETVPGSQLLVGLFRSLGTETVGRTANGSYRIRATGVTDRDRLEQVLREPAVRKVSFEATVRPDGLLRSYELRYETDREYGTVGVTRRFRHERVGSTTVERPTWFDEALNASESE
jgi:hypothetical protein